MAWKTAPAAGRSWSAWGLGLVLMGLLGLLACSACGIAVWLWQTAAPAAPTPTVFPYPGASPTPSATPTRAPTPTATPTAEAVPFRAVVQIVALDADGQPLWTGSGTLVDADGLILTNAHIVLPGPGETPPADLLVLMTQQEDRPPTPRFYAQVLQADPDLDLAVLRIVRDLDGNPVDPASLGLPTISLGDADALRLGDELVILGYPGIGGNTITLTKGEVAGFTGEEPYGPRAFIKTTATLAGGNSGGAALDAHGRLVAVPTLLGAGSKVDEVVDCRVLVDTNHDGVVDDEDACVPIGGFINALRPVNLAEPLLAAARRGEVAIPTPQPTPTAARSALDDIWRHPGPVLAREPFNAPVEGWSTTNDPDMQVTFTEGTMRALLRPTDAWYSFTWGLDVRDVVVTVRARVTRSAGDGEFGLVCRYRDLNNTYGASVLEDGSFYIWKLVDGEFEELHPFAPLPDEAHFDPRGWTEIGLICFGPHLALWVNGAPVVLVSDGALSQGDAGLVVGTFEGANFEVAFDDLVIRRARR